MAPRVGPLILALGLSGCGGDSPSSPDSPAPTEVPAQQCRRYATTFTITPTSANGDWTGTEESATCTFDRTSATLRCTFTHTDPDRGCLATERTSAVYASVTDFVEETTAVGLLRHRQLHTVDSGCNSSTSTASITYDGMKRPLSYEYESSQGLWVSSTFAGWDALGRPAQQVSDSLNCVQHRSGYTYDDATRTVTLRTLEVGTGGLCGSADYAVMVAYDPDGNVVRSVTFRGGKPSEVHTTTIAATETVCY